MSRATDDLARGLNEDLRRLEAELTELKIMIGTLREARAGMRASRPPAAANDNADQTSAPADQAPSTAPTVVVRPRPSGWWPRTILECRSFTRSDDPRVDAEDEAPTRKIAGLFALVLALACSLASACANTEVPAGAEAAPAEVVAMARAAWIAAGLPSVAGCQVQPWLTVSFEEFRDTCGKQSCAEPGATWETCEYACSVIPEDGGPSWSLYAGEAPADFAGYHMPRAEAVAHETMHVWAMCALRDVDMTHARAEIWHDAIAGFRKLSR